MRARFELYEREAEMAAVREAIKDATDGHGGLILVEGAAGIGKTCLLAAAKVAATKACMCVGSARSTKLEQDFSFGVVRQLFEPLLKNSKIAQEDLWQGAASTAKQVFTHTANDAVRLGDFAVLHGLYWLTANLSQERPLVLLVDDLQWCDMPSLRYFTHLLPRIEDINVLVVAALRTGDLAREGRLVQQLAANLDTRVLRPQPLGVEAASGLLKQILPEADPQFIAVCHSATGGNPLLLQELGQTIAATGTIASAENSSLVQSLGRQAVASLIATRMAPLPDSAIGIARAVAILEDRASLSTVAALTGQSPVAALTDAGRLEELQILRVNEEGDEGELQISFVHPLVKAAIHDSMSYAERTDSHRRAAHLLAASGTDPERVAVHLLHAPSAANQQEQNDISLLRAAANAAASHGSPEGAHLFLRRALGEPDGAAERLNLLIETGEVAFLVDNEAAAKYLQQAYDMANEPSQRASIADKLGTAYEYLLDSERSLAIRSEALGELSGEDDERWRRLQAGRLSIATMTAPGNSEILDSVDDLHRLAPQDSAGARLLDCAIACRDMVLCDPSAITRARNALADGVLVQQETGESSVLSGWYTLLAADDDLIMESTGAALKLAHAKGSLAALGPAYGFRAFGWLLRGHLPEAEHDIRESRRIADLAGTELGRFWTGIYLADILLEAGSLNEAESVVRELGIFTDKINPQGPLFYALTVLSRLCRLREDHSRALSAALQAQQRCEIYDIHNPALVDWRTEAALALQALGRVDEAQEIITEDLRLSMQWGAPRAIGRSMRIKGLIIGGQPGLGLLRESVIVLQSSPALLEYAKALTALGAALRHDGQRASARPHLRQAVDIASRCGAAAVVERARAELIAAGGRRITAQTGPESLTPSERRVAEIAAQGSSNRQIAQALFVTPKTVEVHLSAVYRKLSISSRTEIGQLLESTS